MTYQPNNYTGNGTNRLFTVSFPYLSQEDVVVEVGGTVLTLGVDYTFVSASQIELTTAPAVGAPIRISRATKAAEPQAVFQSGSAIPAENLNDNFKQTLYVAQELIDVVENSEAGEVADLVNAASTTAGLAFSTANAAQATANAAEATANSIAGTATAAQTDAANAVSTANAAAASVDGKVNRAGDTLTGPVNVPILNGGQLAGHRNRLLNGNFIISQRVGLNSHTITTGATYYLDRWRTFTAGANANAQLVDAGLGSEPRYRYRLTGAAGVTGLNIQQLIEQANILDLAGQQVTLSVRTRNSLLTTLNWQIDRANATNDWSSSTVVSLGSWTISDTLATYSTTLTLPTQVFNGLAVRLFVGAQTSGQWDIAHVQLEPGPLATPFEWRDYGDELSMCRRYYFAGTSGATLNTQSITANVSFNSVFPTPMRAVPTITGWTPSFTNTQGWTGFQNVAGLSWAGNVSYTASAEL
jgi:hypothetical protein